MAYIQSPSGVWYQEIDQDWRAARVAISPPQGPWFMLTAESGAIAGVAAGASIFSLRNAHASLKVMISRIGVRYFITTAFTAAQELGIDIFRATSWSVSDSGQTAVTVIPKLSVTGTSLFSGAANGDMRISTTAAISAGTRTLDTQPIFRKSITAQNTAGGLILDEVIEFNENGDCPLILGNNEGIIISPRVTLGAAGVMRLQVRPRWRELAVPA